jgi:hypothetical membrane protein
MESFKKIYDKIPASYFSFIGLAIFLIGIIPAMIVQPNFNIFTYTISDLGSPINSLYIFFDVCWFITGIFMIFFLFGFTLYLQEKGVESRMSWIAFLFTFLSALGLLGLAVFNKIDALGMHELSQYLFFFTGIVYLILYFVIELKNPEFSKLQAWFNLIVAFFFILYLSLFIISKIIKTFPQGIRIFTEWLFLYANLLWFLENGLYMLLKR